MLIESEVAYPDGDLLLRAACRQRAVHGTLTPQQVPLRQPACTSIPTGANHRSRAFQLRPRWHFDFHLLNTCRAHPASTQQQQTAAPEADALQTLIIESVPAQVAAAASAYPVPAATPATDNVEDNDDEEFLDPVTKEVIIDPVVGSDGITYDRCAISSAGRLNT